eukprot:g5256.t1
MTRQASPAGKTVITFGTFDLFHYGHLRIVQRAAEHGDRLVVGVSSDNLNWKKKQARPAVSEEQRMAIVRALDCVDEVFLEESLEEKAAYCKQYGADLLVMGDDHRGRFDEICAGVCPVAYLPRTRGISSTKLKRDISSDALSALEKGKKPPSPLCTEATPPAASSLPGQSALPPPRVGPNSSSKANTASSSSPSEQYYAATGKNLVRSANQSNPVTEFLVTAHDYYYDAVMAWCTPFCAVMPGAGTIQGQ